MTGRKRIRGRSARWGGRLGALGIAALLAVVLAPQALADPPQPSCTGTTTVVCTFAYTDQVTNGPYQWTVPTGVTSVTVDLYGAQGGGVVGEGYTEPFSRGRGAHVRAVLNVASLVTSTLTVRVGQQGQQPGLDVPVGAYNGGGPGGTTNGPMFSLPYGGGGGGASDVRVGGSALSDRILVAGGGGGWPGMNFGLGGDSGSAPVNAGAVVLGGGGGTQSEGGAGSLSSWSCAPPSPSDVPGLSGASGVLGQGGNGGTGGNWGGGGGGGGYYGGGGGSGGFYCAAATGLTGTGGGGGSSQVAMVSGVDVPGATISEGARTGDGLVTITYSTAGGGATGSLSGSRAAPAPSPIDLSAAGTEDWAVWGFASGGTSTSLAPDVRKSGGTAISSLTDVNTPAPIPLRGLGQFAPPFTFSWSNGAPAPSSATAAKVGIQHNGGPPTSPTVSTLGTGFSFTVPAGTEVRTLKVWVGLNRAGGQLQATLSDGSAAAFTDSYNVGTDDNVGAVYTITYNAATAGQTLTVSWVENADSCVVFRCDNVSIHAVALSGGGGGGGTGQEGPTFTVNTTTDHDDEVCSDTDCTLREAIVAANGAEGANTIHFSVGSVVLASELPELTDEVTIDGQGSPPEIDGSGLDEPSDGIHLAPGAAGSVVRNLSISGVPGSAVLVESSGTTVTANTLTGNGAGVEVRGGIEGDGPPSNVGVIGNTIRDGTGAAAVTVVNGAYVEVSGNTITGQDGDGIAAEGSYRLIANGNEIGDPTGLNLALANTGAGIRLDDLSPFAPSGGSAELFENTVAHNGGIGILVRGQTTRAALVSNLVYGNAGQAIDNSPLDGPDDPGAPAPEGAPNGGIRPLTLTTATIVPSENHDQDVIDVSGTFYAPAGEQQYTVSIFSSSTDAPEARVLLGEATVSLGGESDGIVSFEIPGDRGEGGKTDVPPAESYVTAMIRGSGGTSSELSGVVPASTSTPPLVTGLTVSGPATVPAGAGIVPLAQIPPLALVTPQTSGTQAAPVNQSPVNQSPVNQLPVNQLPVNQSPVNQSPVNQLPVNQSPVNQSGLGPDFASLVLTPGPLGDTALSTIPLLSEGGWSTLLTGTALAGTPLQSVTLRQVLQLSPLPARLQPDAQNPLLFADIDFSNSLIGSLPAMTLALGQLPLTGISGIDFCLLFSGPPLSCTGSLPAGTSLLSAALEGAPVNQSPVNQSPVNQSLIDALALAEAPVNQLPVNQLPVNQLPVNQLPVNQSRILSLPVNQLPVNQSPVNQLSLAAILAANAPVNQSPVNQLPVNQLPVNQSVLQCGNELCTGTLGDYVGLVVPGATLGDLRLALPGDVPDSWTIANLEDFAGLLVGDLLASLPQPNDLTLADVLALALFSNNPESFAFETLNIFDTSLSLFASPLESAPYTVDFTLTPDEGPTGVSADVDVSVTLPRTFAYAEGTTRLVQSPGTCGAGVPVDEPTVEQVGAGVQTTTWSVSGLVGSSYRLCFTARPGIVLGPQSASASATPAGGVEADAAQPEPVSVEDAADDANDTPGTSPTLSTGSLYLSYLTSAADVDYYRFPVPAAGSRVTFHLSHLPADYDLVVYGPEPTALRPASASTPPLDGAPLTDSPAELTHVNDALPSQTLDDLRLQTLPVFGVSTMRGGDPEDITILSDGSGGLYTVQVTSYNGAAGADPYMLRVTTEAPRAPADVPARTVTGTAGAAVGGLPTGFNTLFVVNRERLESFHGSTGANEVMTALDASHRAGFSSLGFPNAVLSVDAYPSVQAAYAAWDASPGDPSLANAVVAAINAVVDAQVRAQPNGAGLKYLVLIGGDRVIPQARLGDFTATANESGYADTFDRSSDLYATLRAGQVLSDDPYATLEPVAYLNRQLHVPRLAVGRLVETPAEIAATLNRFTTFDGRLDPSSSLVTGYDFMQDAARAIDAPFAGRFGAGAASLPSPLTGPADWTRTTLLEAFLPAGGSAPAITSLNGHADHYEFAPPSVAPPFFTSGDLPLGPTTAPAVAGDALANRLVFSMGCHSGLSVSDAVVTASTYDWPQAYAHNGVGAYLGNTGFGYGDSLVIAYSEQLSAIFAQKVAAGATVGNAVAYAKQEYFGSLGVFGVYDEKAMAEFTLYGLPMWSVTQPGGTLAPLSASSPAEGSASGPQLLSTASAAATPTATAVVTDASTGLEAETFQFSDIVNTEQPTADGRYWSGPDGVQVTHFRPLQPKLYFEATGTAGHGALITELRQQADTPGVDPVFARPIVDTASSEPELAFGDVAFPARLQALRTFRQDGVLKQRVVLMTGQFFGDGTPDTAGVGVQRLYDRVGGRVLRSSSTDFTPPTFTRIDAAAVGSAAAFGVDVTDLTGTGAAGEVKRVLVAVRIGTDTTWQFFDLTRVGATPEWNGGIPLPTPDTTFEYFLQAVDAAGNVAVSTNKGFYFAAADLPAPTGDVTVAPAAAIPASGWFGGPTAVVADGPEGVTLEVSVDGGPFVPVAPGTGPTVGGDGVHVVEARGSNGGSATTLVPIDVAEPTVAIDAPAANGLYLLGGTFRAAFTCSDAGSGIRSCIGTTSAGSAFDTATVGTKTFVVTATDNAGRETTRSVTYVVYPFTGFFQPVDSPPTLNVVKAGSAIPVKFSLGGDRGLAILAPGSPAVTTIDCSSTAPLDAVETLATTTSGLQYDASSNQYTYVWRTAKGSVGCRQFDLQLGDGTSHVAFFKFK